MSNNDSSKNKSLSNNDSSKNKSLSNNDSSKNKSLSSNNSPAKKNANVTTDVPAKKNANVTTDVPAKKNAEVPPEKKNDVINSFFQINTAISKFVFILLLLIIFVLLFHFGMFILEHVYGSKRTPYVMKGMIESNVEHIVSSNPNYSKSVPIIRSVNELTGIEFTWSLWVFIEDPFLNEDHNDKRIFSKGSYSIHDSINNPLYNIAYLNNSPGLYYNHTNNKFVLVINTYSSDENIYELIDIDNIPIEKWISCVITLKDRKINIYINGNMTKEYILKYVPKQNYYDTIIGDKKGFGGFISNLRYYDHAINIDTIQTIMHDGPDTTKEMSSKVYDAPPWLSMNWYYN